MNQWYALRSTPRGEFRADEELEQAGIERFTPTYKRSTLIRHTKGRAREIVMPLMSGYLFAQLDFSPRSHHPSLLDGCKHIVEPINIWGTPIPVRANELEALRLLCAAGAFDEGKKRGHDNRFRNGDLVRITGGPLMGFTVTFREVADGSLRPRAGHVKVLLERMLGIERMVDVPQEMIEAA
jgi:transcription antitermination factor NusG